MKNRFSTFLTVLLVAVLIGGAVCIGGVKGYKEEREELLLTCVEMHVKPGIDLADSIEDCEEAAADFDARLKYQLMGKVAGAFGVEPITESVTALHAQLVQTPAAVQEAPNLLEQLGHQVGELMEDNIDTKLSWSKVFWTIVFLSAIFGRKGRKKGFTLGKLLAGFGLFRLWKKK